MNKNALSCQTKQILHVRSTVLAKAGHSYLFQVRLDGQIYALKLYTLLQPHWQPSIFENHALAMDPFIVESRTYDYLTEHDLNGAVGPQCYGWLAITESQEETLDRKLHVGNWRRRQDTSDDLSVDYYLNILKASHLTPKSAQSLRDQLELLHSLKIVHGDLFPHNMMASKKRSCLFSRFQRCANGLRGRSAHAQNIQLSILGKRREV
ncbi:hypothetical protein LOZ66_005412 [Ophidiomyces ophidiicola]|nr:hypothetical protein LOZ66_005412 [Ophidiomyces ophidiicola]